ncbi:hypothetical protein Tco_1226647 [Tanacetum coccineum]
MLAFDVILGMDCSHLCYEGTYLISHGVSNGFLASVMDTSLESPNIENLSVVHEFADVFPDELPGLPPAREIEFGIELISGAEPISKAPYRMTPVELKELKEQLQEMLENGFLDPSVSPWGAAVVSRVSLVILYSADGILWIHQGLGVSPNGPRLLRDVRAERNESFEEFEKEIRVCSDIALPSGSVVFSYTSELRRRKVLVVFDCKHEKVIDYASGNSYESQIILLSEILNETETGWLEF